MMDVVLRMFKGVERGVGLFRSTILKLRALSLRSVVESLQVVRKEGVALKVSKRRLLRDRLQPAYRGLYIRSHAQKRRKEGFP
jgi:hypothetical protein